MSRHRGAVFWMVPVVWYSVSAMTIELSPGSTHYLYLEFCDTEVHISAYLSGFYLDVAFLNFNRTKVVILSLLFFVLFIICIIYLCMEGVIFNKFE